MGTAEGISAGVWRADGVAGEYAFVFGRDGGGAFLGVGVGGMEEASARGGSGMAILGRGGADGGGNGGGGGASVADVMGAKPGLGMVLRMGDGLAHLCPLRQ